MLLARVDCLNSFRRVAMTQTRLSDPTAPENNPPENPPETDPPYEDPVNPASPVIEPGEDVDDGDRAD
jgi:hypothetical protein